LPCTYYCDLPRIRGALQSRRRAEVAARRYPGPGIGDRKLQITDVRDHHGSVHDTGEDVDQQMRGDVDVRPLLFTVSEKIMNVASGTGLPLASCTITSH
jgi:hypothetical protein